MYRFTSVICAGILWSLLNGVSSFSTSQHRLNHHVGFVSCQSPVHQSSVSLSAYGDSSDGSKMPNVVSKSALIMMAALLLSTSAVNADEIGRETEAPTLFTGETLLICTKRGPLGACTKTEYRTEENDNDKADNYFKKPSELVKRKDAEARAGDTSEGNALIAKLRQQSDDNREKNELLVQQKTFMNDKSASFGPFDSQVLILNENGKGFTLLENPQAMRLKKDGFIQDRRFVKQPTQDEIDAALTVEDGPSIFDRFFGE